MTHLPRSFVSVNKSCLSRAAAQPVTDLPYKSLLFSSIWRVHGIRSPTSHTPERQCSSSLECNRPFHPDSPIFLSSAAPFPVDFARVVDMRAMSSALFGHNRFGQMYDICILSLITACFCPSSRRRVSTSGYAKRVWRGCLPSRSHGIMGRSGRDPRSTSQMHDRQV